MARMRSKLNYSNIMSTIAVVMAMSGSAWAAATVTSADVVDNSLRGTDVRDSTLLARDLATASVGASEIRIGGVGSAEVADNALNSNDVSLLHRDDFAAGELTPNTTDLPNGLTLRGAFRASHGLSAASNVGAFDAVSFGGWTLPTEPTPHYIRNGDTVPDECNGGTLAQPEADSGHLCVFERGRSANVSFIELTDPRNGTNYVTWSAATGNVSATGGTGVVAPFGFQVTLSPAGTSNTTEVYGTWAVTS